MENNSPAVLIPKLTIIYPGGDTLTSLLLEREKNTVILDLIGRLCTLRAIDTKNLKVLNDVGKKIDTKLTVEQAGVVFIELIDKKIKNNEKVKSHIEDAGAGKIRKGKPDSVVLKIGEWPELTLRQQLFDEEWESLQNFKSKHEICKSFSDEFVMCSLWARKFDDTRTLKLLQDNLQWRKDNGFDKIPSIRELEEITRGLSKMYNIIPGTRDKNGGGIIYVSFKKDVVFGVEPITVTSLKKWLAWYYYVGMFRDGLDALRPGWTFVEDLSEFGWSHFDLDIQKQLNVYQIFPLRIRRFIMINPPAIFNAVIKIGKTFLSAKMLSRIETTNKPNYVANYVTNDQLWTQFGGEVEITPKEWADKLIDWGYKNEAHYQIPFHS